MLRSVIDCRRGRSLAKIFGESAAGEGSKSLALLTESSDIDWMIGYEWLARVAVTLCISTALPRSSREKMRAECSIKREAAGGS